MRYQSSLEDRFWRKVDRTGACWIWRGVVSPKGYGKFGTWDGTKTRVRQAHRVAWELTHGPIPAGLSVCHNCPTGDNPGCINPSHLWLGTTAENQADMAAKGRARAPRGSAAWCAKLTEQDVRTIRARHAEGRTSCVQIAATYGVDPHTIGMIVRRLTWRHLD
jgi:hypothetical protein